MALMSSQQLCAVFAFLMLTITTQALGAELDKSISKDVEEVAIGNNQFTNQLFKALRESSNPAEAGNLIFSPLSLSTVMAMLQPGAKGSTATQIQTGLRFPANQETLLKGYKELLHSLKSNENFTLETGNRVYSNQGFELNPNYVQLIQDNFHTTVEQLDFSASTAAANKINGWVEEVTRNKIKDLISSSDLNDLTKLVLVNAIYFKGKWKNQFNPKFTQKAPFYLSGNNSVEVDMMKIETELPYADVPELNAKAVSIPYQGDRLFMTILLPNVKDGLSELESKLESFDLNKLNFQSVKIQLQLPKFKLESTIDLKDPLTKLGLKDMWESGLADFSGISKSGKDAQGLYVSKAVQKAFIEVNEEGSEAAAATGSTIRTRRSVPEIDQPVVFKANHPFIAIIIARNHIASNQLGLGITLFQGLFSELPVNLKKSEFKVTRKDEL